MPRSISVAELRERLEASEPPVVLDVRRSQAFADSPCLIPGATRLLPETVDTWAGEIPENRQVVAYCVLGQQVSQGVVARLEQLGIDACFLEGGIEQWKADGGLVSAADPDSLTEEPAVVQPTEAQELELPTWRGPQVVREAMRFDKARLSTGLHIHYAESGDPRGTPVVFVHGWPDSWFSFSRVLPLLPATLRLIALDQRGFGESDHPDSGYTIPGFAADLVGLLDALEIDRAVLVGHSYGTFVARCAAIAAPERVLALALIGTGASTKINGADDLQAALRDLPDPIPESFAREFQSGTVYHPVPAEFFDRIIQESLKIPPRLWPVMIDCLMAYDDTRELGKIRAPTLLLWGDHDALFSRAQQDAFLAAVPAARLEVYQETGHCPNWERPEWVATDIADFIADAVAPAR